MLAEEIGEISVHAPLSAGAVAPGGVHFSGAAAAAMAVNLHSRIASRVLLRIAHRPYRDEEDIFAFAREQRWEDWFSAQETLRVDITAIKSPLHSLEFATLRVKDGICDRLRERTGERPDIDTALPDVRVSVFLTATDCTLYLDTSGEPLFKRGWRLDKGAAPLRENLAAGILRLTGWQPGTPLYDPMCGSGTFIAEAAQAALGMAPGAQRRFGFQKLRPFEATAWERLKAAALARQRPAAGDLQIFGSDISGEMLDKARYNLRRAGVPEMSLKQVDARAMTAPTEQPGIVVANPPYGERIEVRGPRGELREVVRPEDDDTSFQRAQPDHVNPDFFRAFGDALKQHFAGWQAYVLTTDRTLPGQMRLREKQKTPLFNGALECRLFRFDMIAGTLRRPRAEPGA